MKPLITPVRLIAWTILCCLAPLVGAGVALATGPGHEPAQAQPDAAQRPTIYVLLVTVMTGDGKLLAGSKGPYSSLERCRAVAQAEMQMWAQKRAMDVTPACAALYVTQRMVEDLVIQEQAPARGEQPVNPRTKEGMPI